MSTMQLNTARRDVAQQWAKAILLSMLIVGALMVLSNFALASDGEEFAEASAKFETWVTGNLGKMAAFVALAVGSVVAAVRKDWTWFFGAVVLSIGVGVVVSVVNASFSAIV